MKRVGHWAGGVLLLVASLLLAEGMLQLASAWIPAISRLLAPSWSMTPQLEDSLLGTRGNPRWPDHDANGFRNPRVLSRADAVMLGDSHTYGIGVAQSESWPAVMAAESGLSTYSMALPGWGPGQGHLVLEDALELRPDLVVYALYFGNDLFDAFSLVPRRSELRTLVPLPLLDSAMAIEAQAPIAERVRYLFSLGDTAAHPSSEGLLQTVRRALSRHSRVYALARTLRDRVTGSAGRTPALLSRDLERALAGISGEQRRFISVYRGAEWRTLLTPAYRNLVLDDRDPRIRTGVEVTKAILVDMNSVCRRRGIRFLTVLLPTKETVFRSRVGDAGASGALDSVVHNERRIREEVMTLLRSSGIEYVDVLQDLETSGVQPYFEDADGHPNAAGHRVIGKAILRRISTH